MTSFTIWEAAFCALMYFIAMCEFNFWPLFFYHAQANPMFIGFVFGLFFGDMKAGLIMGATINVLYLANAQPGANMAQDQALASCVAIPIALKLGLDASMALTLAVPFGLLGVPLDNVIRLLNGYWTRRAEKDIDKLNFSGLRFDAVIGPTLMRFVFRFVPAFLLLLIGGTAAQDIINRLPQTVLEALGNLGALLPVLGLVLCLRLIGRINLLPYYIIGYFATKLFGFNALTMFIFAACFALLHYQFIKNDPEYNRSAGRSAAGEMEVKGSPFKEGNSILPARYHKALPYRQAIFFRISQSLEYYFATGYMYAVLPAMKFLYKDDPEALKAALHRHNVPFVSTIDAANLIWGSVIAMEEAKSQGEEISDSTINTLKSGLMGPVAGFADTINWYTIQPLLLTAFIPLGMAGNPLSQIWWVIFGIYLLVTSYVYYNAGYTLGKSSILNLLRSGKLNLVLTCAGVLGTYMMGVLVAQNASMVFTAEFATSQTSVTLQSILDNMVPGLAVAIYSLASYFYLHKGGKYTRLLGFTVIFVVLLTVLGIM